MKLMKLFLCLFLVSITVISCKDEAKKVEVATEEGTVTDSEETKNIKNTTGAQEVLANSILAKLMATPESKTFVSNVISAGIIDLLSKEEGPFTLFVPTNAAFEALPEFTREDLSRVENREALITLVKNHITEEDLSSADLLQTVKKNGAHTIKTMGGASLMVYLDGTDIMLKDSLGAVARVGKSDILASNGKVHIVDAVLTITK